MLLYLSVWVEVPETLEDEVHVDSRDVELVAVDSDLVRRHGDRRLSWWFGLVVDRKKLEVWVDK